MTSDEAMDALMDEFVAYFNEHGRCECGATAVGRDTDQWAEFHHAEGCRFRG